MSYPTIRLTVRRTVGLFAGILATVAAGWAGGCSSTSHQQSFASPNEAVDALVGAIRTSDKAQMQQILGPAGDELISSGDDVADRAGMNGFLSAYDQKHTMEVNADDCQTLCVGNDDWPLPIPIVKSGNGWQFDTAEGKEEVLSRRIGRNELATIQVCLAIVDAQRDYYAMDVDGTGPGQYAQRILSQSGKHDGLYWETAEGAPGSPLGPLVATAEQEGYSPNANVPAGQRSYHGYHYRVLKSQGRYASGGAMSYLQGSRMTRGFAIVAYPDTYGNSGIMTFMISQSGVLYQKDLGKDTSRAAAGLTEFNPDMKWQIVR